MAVKKTSKAKGVSSVKTATSSKKPTKKPTAKKTASPKKQTSSAKAPATEKNPVAVTEMPGGTFVIGIGTARLFFALDEMRLIVKICHAAASEREAAVRLFSWFSKYRSDVIKEVQIKTNHDENLGFIYKYLVTHYAVKQE